MKDYAFEKLNELDIQLLKGLENTTNFIRLRGIILFVSQVVTAFIVTSLVVKLILIVAIAFLYKVVKPAALDSFPKTDDYFDERIDWDSHNKEFLSMQIQNSLKTSIKERRIYNPRITRYERCSMYIYLLALYVSLFLT